MTKADAHRLLATSALAVFALTAQARAEEKAKFLPFLGPHLEAARYAPADEEFSWVGWIGANVDLVEKGNWAVYFTPQVETILGHRIRSFEAVQANYSLEIGAHFDRGRGRLSPFFHHVSRHLQDREKTEAVDWNFLGVRYDAPWPAAWKRSGAWSASLAVATLASAVEYNWEGRLSADLDVLGGPGGALFLLADVRHVGAAATPEFPRDRITDFRSEMGYRRFQEMSQFALFVAFEHRNDALIPRGLVTNRALFGFRIRSQKRASPATVPLP